MVGSLLVVVLLLFVVPVACWVVDWLSCWVLQIVDLHPAVLCYVSWLMAFVSHTLALSLVPFCSCWSSFSFSFVETAAFHSSFERVSLAYCSFASFAVAVVETVVVVTLAAFSFALSFTFTFTFALVSFVHCSNVHWCWALVVARCCAGQCLHSHECCCRPVVFQDDGPDLVVCCGCCGVQL